MEDSLNLFVRCLWKPKTVLQILCYLIFKEKYFKDLLRSRSHFAIILNILNNLYNNAFGINSIPTLSEVLFFLCEFSMFCDDCIQHIDENLLGKGMIAPLQSRVSCQL